MWLPLSKAYTALIPKEAVDSTPPPDEFRPMSVLSAIYRLWARARFLDGLTWQESWAHSQSWACCKGQGAETMAMQIALQLEESALNPKGEE